jgi:hypothetical protein
LSALAWAMLAKGTRHLRELEKKTGRALCG